jgi:hypothetical protein
VIDPAKDRFALRAGPSMGITCVMTKLVKSGSTCRCAARGSSTAGVKGRVIGADAVPSLANRFLAPHG